MNILIHGVPDDEFLSFLKSKNKVNPIDAFVTEGRPLLTGRTVVTDKLGSIGLNGTIITDNMVACLMKESLFDHAFVFFHEIEDTHLICQIGAAIVALCAKHFGVPVYYHRAEKLENRDYGHPKDLLLFDGIRIAPTQARTYIPLLEKVPFPNLQGDLNTFASEG